MSKRKRHLDHAPGAEHLPRYNETYRERWERVFGRETSNQGTLPEVPPQEPQEG